jgi:hypothetical protein
MKVLKAAVGLLMVVGLCVFAAVAANAQDPKPGSFVFVTDATGHQISSSSPEGYTHPPAAYKVGDTFSYHFNLNNHGVPPAFTDHSTAHDVFIFSISRLGLDGKTDFTEAELEAAVHNGHDGGQTVVFTSLPQEIDLPNATTVPVTESHTLTASMVPSGCGYFQFDFRMTTQTSTSAAMNSGFFRILPCAAGAVSPTSTTAPTTTTTSNVSAARLAQTGGGPADTVPWYIAVLIGSGLVALGARVAFRKVS